MNTRQNTRLTEVNRPPAAPSRAGRRVEPLIDIPDDGLGPSMLALNGAQRAFVTALVIHGLTQTAAAEAAGYSASSRHTLEVVGSKLAHREDIQAAILELGCKIMRTEGPKSIRFLAEVRDATWLETKDRVKAAVELLNRSGFVATTQHNVNVEHTHHLSDSQKDARIIELCRELGVPETEARKMLIAPDQIIDAAFEEVEPIGPPTAARAKQDRRNALARERKKLTPEELAERKAANLAAQKERRRLAEEERALAAIMSEPNDGEAAHDND